MADQNKKDLTKTIRKVKGERMNIEPLKGKKKNRFRTYPNVDFYDGEDVAGAVEWLKKEIVKSELNKPSNNVFQLIDEAFSDVTKKEGHVCKTDFEGVCWGCGRVMSNVNGIEWYVRKKEERRDE